MARWGRGSGRMLFTPIVGIVLTIPVRAITRPDLVGWLTLIGTRRA